MTKKDSHANAGTNTQPLLADKGVAERYGVHPSTIWRWSRGSQKSREGVFPKPIKVGPGCARWRLSDLLEYEQKSVEDV
ncbi:AlpA family transcriptional regulator [Halomonas sp. ANAO-440]|nr:AlpA family transcriptional regulator [Halomonas sp. ANAO-440]